MSIIGKKIKVVDDILAKGTLYSGTEGIVRMETATTFIMDVGGIPFIVPKNSTEIVEDPLSQFAVDIPPELFEQCTPGKLETINDTRKKFWDSSVLRRIYVNIGDMREISSYRDGTMFMFIFVDKCIGGDSQSKQQHVYAIKGSDMDAGGRVVFDYNGMGDCTLTELLSAHGYPKETSVICTADGAGLVVDHE